MNSFANPEYFAVLLLVPLYLGVLWWKRKMRKNEAVQVSVFSDLKKAQGATFARYLTILRHILVVAAIILFALTLARSQSAREKRDVTKQGIDIIIALDVSQSMLAEDLEPNRITAAKESLKQFIKNIEDDRLGIIVFSGTAFTQSPLTFDYNILTEYVDTISTDSINQRVSGLGGTAVGDAILAATNRFKNDEDRTKVLILLTDGDANTGVEPSLAAKKAAEEGIKLYTVGIGKEEGAPIPVTDQLGERQFLRNPDGSLLIARFNEENLKELAQIGGGQYFRVDDRESFQETLQEIETLQKRDITISTTTEYTENFYPFLLGLTGVLALFVITQSAVPVFR